MKTRAVIGKKDAQTDQPVPGESGNGLINIVLRAQELLLGRVFVACSDFFFA